MRTRLAGHAGFTLLELMITIAVAAVLAAVAIPNMRDFIRNNRLTAAANDLLHSAQIARSEAIKRQRNVVVCASADPHAAAPQCSYGAFKGWIVFQDTNANWAFDGDDTATAGVDEGEVVIERHDLIDASVTVRNDLDAIVSYAATGFVNVADEKRPSTRIVFCDERGNQAVGNSSSARAVFIEETGRARVTKNRTDVGGAITTAGACP
jgi:prepilin-type N-terminal cleavage/methylation domain-containing protein